MSFWHTSCFINANNKNEGDIMAETTSSTQMDKQTYNDFLIENMMACNAEASVNDELVNHLHSTLDVYQLLENFNTVFKEKVLCDGIEYNDETTQTYLLNGTKGHPSCIYTLRYQEEVLGTISISRDSVFQDYEVEMIEVLLAGLTLPLRNALRYKQSVQYTQRDELTGLRTASYYNDMVELEIKRAKRYKAPFSILLFDIDDFESINSRYGRVTGDAILIEVARRLNLKARSSDIVYRTNADEFLVFLPNTLNDKALEAGERLRDFIVEDKFITKDRNLKISVSMSVTTVGYEDTVSRLMDRARNSLIHEKMLARNYNAHQVEEECDVLGDR